jgi:AraC-like DNA-binding protein
VDVFSDQLARAQARGAVFSTLYRRDPWGLEFSGARPLTVHILLEGEGWLLTDDAPPLPLGRGDALLAKAGSPYRLVGDTEADAEPISDARARGSDPEGTTQILCGAYVIDGSVGQALLASLPRFVHLPAADQDRPHQAAIALLAEEANRDGAGQQNLLDRLLDLNLVYALRTWWSGHEHQAPGWFRATEHPRLRPVIEAMHQSPQQPWTLEQLAAKAALSRASFAAAFKAATGESPGRYLTRLRMSRAEDALTTGTQTIAAIAHQVGYRNEFAFATAFRRQYGVAPGRWRNHYRKAVDLRVDTLLEAVEEAVDARIQER